MTVNPGDPVIVIEGRYRGLRGTVLGTDRDGDVIVIAVKLVSGEQLFRAGMLMRDVQERETT